MNNRENDLVQKFNYRKASNRLEQLKKFYLRLGVYLTVNLFLFIMWIKDAYVAEYFWVGTTFFTTIIAGLFILSNAVNLFGQRFFLSERWEQRKLKDLINKEIQQTTKYE